jgi:hypothetical protein
MGNEETILQEISSDLKAIRKAADTIVGIFQSAILGLCVYGVMRWLGMVN